MVGDFSRSQRYAIQVVGFLGVSAPIVGTTSLENLKDIIGKWKYLYEKNISVDVEQNLKLGST